MFSETPRISAIVKIVIIKLVFIYIVHEFSAPTSVPYLLSIYLYGEMFQTVTEKIV